VVAVVLLNDNASRVSTRSNYAPQKHAVNAAVTTRVAITAAPAGVSTSVSAASASALELAPLATLRDEAGAEMQVTRCKSGEYREGVETISRIHPLFIAE
jgi:hypothetical protein